MNQSGAAFTMILLFALRCIAPLVLTVFIGWLMNRLVDRWEVEETAVIEQPKTQLPQPVPSSTARPALPALINCWVFNNCEESDCVAFENTAVACWQVKQSSSGQLLAKCETCPVYVQSAPAV
ncbi:MAG: hypothetical protein DWQ04_01910 [Chloroflexi bacterium]|nr:MAG: hypothetical protein DWQ04_01910 [Chloroflexota bacterium]